MSAHRYALVVFSGCHVCRFRRVTICDPAEREDVTVRDEQFRTEQFERDRPRLLAVAYRMLGSITEAEDALQEAWLRVSRVRCGRRQRRRLADIHCVAAVPEYAAGAGRAA